VRVVPQRVGLMDQTQLGAAKGFLRRYGMAQIPVELFHQRRGRGIVHVPEADGNAGCSGVKECAYQAEHTLAGH